MLILTRRVGEKLLIGDDVSVTVSGVTGGQVRLAIKAPRETVILRKEVPYDAEKNKKRTNEKN